MNSLLVFLLLALLPQGRAFSQSNVRLAWQQKPQLALAIDVANLLTPQQKKLLYSGLSALSHFEIQSRDRDGSTALLFVSECTLKYNLWEERFELQQLTQGSMALQAFDDFAHLCLMAQLSSPSSFQRITESGSHIEILIDVAQVSPAFAADVRRWLIEQQSGVMRGLFSHMLGELQLSESIKLSVVAPPLSAGDKR